MFAVEVRKSLVDRNKERSVMIDGSMVSRFARASWIETCRGKGIPGF